MRERFDGGGDGNPDINAVVAQYRDAMRKRMRWVGPGIGLLLLLVVVLTGTYSVEPGEKGVVRTFGRMEQTLREPGLHFVFPIAQSVDVVNVAEVRREEIGFKSTPDGSKRIDSEALMLTGDENIIEAQMIVQYKISDPGKYLFKLNDPVQSLHIAAEVALRGVVGQMRITSSVEELVPSDNPAVLKAIGSGSDVAGEGGEKKDEPEEDTPEEGEPEDEEGDDAPEPKTPPPPVVDQDPPPNNVPIDPNTDILTTGRERAQVRIKEKLQELMDLYESGLQITEVKLQDVDAPDEVKDAFHDVVRAREEREQLINKALGYRQDRLPKARGEEQKIIRAAEGYKSERVLRAQGEASRFTSILEEYRKAQGVTRERLHLETMERILSRAPKKILIDGDVAQNSLPILPLGQNILGGGSQ